MYALYKIVTGPLVWAAFGIFICGSLYRIFDLYRSAKRSEPFVFSYFSFKYGLRSIIHWITPFGAVNMRLNPVMTIVSFLFHICLILTPIFLTAHIVLWEEAWGNAWPSLPEGLADIMTIIVIAATVFFLIRRLAKPEVKYLTDASDFILLGIVAAPFATGLYCSFGWPGYQTALILHILSGEIMLAAIPFTRLIHMAFALFTRAYMGSEFGGVRHARDW